MRSFTIAAPLAALLLAACAEAPAPEAATTGTATTGTAAPGTAAPGTTPEARLVSLEGFTPIASEAAFRERVVGRPLRYPGDNVIVIEPDGALSGRIGAEPVSGRWEWVEGAYCRELIAGGRDLGAACQRPLVAGDRVRFLNPNGVVSDEARLG